MAETEKGMELVVVIKAGGAAGSNIYADNKGQRDFLVKPIRGISVDTERGNGKPVTKRRVFCWRERCSVSFVGVSANPPYLEREVLILLCWRRCSSSFVGGRGVHPS